MQYLAPSPQWIVIESSGGLIQNYRSSLPHDQLTVIEVDYDEFTETEPEDRDEYYECRLLEIRETVPPGPYRRWIRYQMASAACRLWTFHINPMDYAYPPSSA